MAIVDMCPPGAVSPIGVVPCDPCPKGTYQDQQGYSDCKPCPPGTTSLTDNNNHVNNCEGKALWSALVFAKHISMKLHITS